MKTKELNKLYEKAKAEYLAEVQDDNGTYFCKGCGANTFQISIHHIIKRSKLKYYFADKRNFIALCDGCHISAEGTIWMQEILYCYDEMVNTKEFLLMEYAGLELYEQSLSFKYGK
jgi:hypothetical protein